MPMQKYHRVIIFLLPILFVPSIWAAASFDGDWVGGFEHQESAIFVQTHFLTAKDGTKGTIDVIDLATDAWFIGKPLEKLELNHSHAHFELASAANRLSFDGQITNGVITGVVEENGGKFPFRLDLIAKINFARFIGTYQV